VNLYPFGKAATIRYTFDTLVEEIDIGGPSLLRAAAKKLPRRARGRASGGLSRVLQELSRDGGPSLDFRFELMRRAFMHHGSVRRHDCDDEWPMSMWPAAR